MNLCRTCKYWSVFAGTVGYGMCLNSDVQLHVNVGMGQGIRTSQNFGCPFHTAMDGTDFGIYSPEVQKQVAMEFYSERFKVDPEILQKGLTALSSKE